MNCLRSISPAGLTLLAVFISFLSISSIDYDELDVLGNWLIGIGGLMIVAASQGEYLSSKKDLLLQKNLLEQQLKTLHERR